MKMPLKKCRRDLMEAWAKLMQKLRLLTYSLKLCYHHDINIIQVVWAPSVKPHSKHKFDTIQGTIITIYYCFCRVEIFDFHFIHRIPWTWLRKTLWQKVVGFLDSFLKDTLEQYQEVVLVQTPEHIFHGNAWTSAEDCVTSSLDLVKSVWDLKTKGVCCFLE